MLRCISCAEVFKYLHLFAVRPGEKFLIRHSTVADQMPKLPKSRPAPPVLFLQDKVLERQLFFRKLPHLLFADTEGFQMLFHNRMLHPNRILLTIAVQCPADDLLRRQLVCRPLVIDHRPDITLYADIREGQVIILLRPLRFPRCDFAVTVKQLIKTGFVIVL